MIDALRRAFVGEDRNLPPDTNFFEAGFTSLQLTDVLAALVEQRLEITLVDLYRYPTLRLLAEEVQRRRGETRGPRPAPWERPRTG